MLALRQRLNEFLLDRQCINFRFVEGGDVVLYVALPEQRRAQPDRLWLESAWRLRDAARIRIGSLDHSEQIVGVLQGIVGTRIQWISIGDITGDLRIGLSNDLVIETFGRSIADEQWEFRAADGVRFGVGPDFQPFERIDKTDVLEDD